MGIQHDVETLAWLRLAQTCTLWRASEDPQAFRNLWNFLIVTQVSKRYKILTLMFVRDQIDPDASTHEELGIIGP